MSSIRITAEKLRAAMQGPRWTVDPTGIDLSAARPSAVVIPVELEPEPRVYLVLRSSHLADHAGEFAFPGGKKDDADENLRATAAREMLEEVRVHEHEMEWLGELSPIPVITGRYIIHPFVGLLHAGVELHAASEEVAEIVAMPILPIVTGNEQIRGITTTWNGVEAFLPHFLIGERILYGATAYLMYELLLRIAAALNCSLAAPIVEPQAPWIHRYTQ